ncbi:hypothetical protein NMG60_11004244 [Bertholletia excelsa]
MYVLCIELKKNQFSTRRGLASEGCEAQAMRFLKNLLHVQIKLVKKFATVRQPKHHFHTNFRQPRANQALKSHLNSTSPTKALSFFRELLRNSISSIDSFSLLFAVRACTKISSPIEGKQLHALVIRLGCEAVVFLQSSLVGLYSVVGNINEAHQVFEEIPIKNIVCWTALISGYVDNNMPNRALRLFREMQMDKIEPDQVTLTVALSACADLGALDMGEWIRTYIHRRKELQRDLSLNNALINMYAKCGDIGTARNLFESMRKKDVTTWTSMIVGHALHGQAKEALALFAAMKEEGKRMKVKKKSGVILPNDVTFIGVLMACSHAGLVEEGRRHFRSMTEDYGLKPRLSHHGCIVDLLCRAGLLEVAYELIMDLPVRPNPMLWRTLLGACGIQGNATLAEKARKQLLELEAGQAGDDVVLSNIYASKGMWDQKIIFRNKIKQRRSPGCSSVAVGGQIHEFVTANSNHFQKKEIYEVLGKLIKTMRADGHAAEL